MKKIVPYGSWESPITAQLVAAATPALDQPVLDGNDVYWLENRPEEGGRSVIVRLDEHGKRCDILPASFSARSRVHEYGGACYIVTEGMLYFVAQHNQRIYQLDTRAQNPVPQALTPDGQGYRFADFCIDPGRDRLLCVAEQHFDTDLLPDKPPTNFIAAVSLAAHANGQAHAVEVVVSGADFYAYPRLSPDHTQLCWLNWHHPSMPWYGSELWQANLDESGQVSRSQKIAGGPEEAVFQPQWSTAGELFFVSDRSQWWNLYRYNPASGVVPVSPLDAEFATPLWTLGMSTYAFCTENRIICCYTQNGSWQLARIDCAAALDSPGSSSGTRSGTDADAAGLTIIDSPYTQISAVTARGHYGWFIGAATDTGNQLVRVDIDSGQCHTVYQFPPPPVDPATFSQPQAVSYETTNGDRSHGFYYPPANPHYQAPSGELPPLIVICHGGPSGATSVALNLKIQFWTSRGFAIFDINYRGSTGYGRRYRERLDSNWGVSDVEDVVMGVRHLIQQGLADPEKLAIRGSSAGGYTVLAALTFHNLFKAGASYYGIGDLETLARDTHKFESRYLDRLIGPYPENAQRYRDRSPIHHIKQLSCPVIFFQGQDDCVVPPSQAEAMVAALRERGTTVTYVPFAGEGHGFRNADNIAQALAMELQFYCDVFSSSPADRT